MNLVVLKLQFIATKVHFYLVCSFFAVTEEAASDKLNFIRYVFDSHEL